MPHIIKRHLFLSALTIALCFAAFPSPLCSQNESNQVKQAKPDTPDSLKSTAPSSQSLETNQTDPKVAGSNESLELLRNGSFEQLVDDFPSDWIFPGHLLAQGFKFELDQENPLAGEVCCLIDSTHADLSKNGFAMLNQSIDADLIRGKRVRFRAAVKTAELSDNGRAQLWLRVDRKTKDGKPVIGAFDNMDARPITSGQWQHYEIVADVNDDVQQMTVGMLVLGKAKAWVDDASLEVIGDDVAVTTMEISAGSNSADAPTQPYLNAWLWLAVITLALFAASQVKNSFIQRIALRFSIAYWVLYNSPMLFMSLCGSIFGALAKIGIPIEWISKPVASFSAAHQSFTKQAVHWTAANVLGIEGKLVLPNGSGDTTFAYIRLLICFVVALAIAVLWSSVYWRKSDHVWLRDMLRTYLRYVLALTMLGYGLHKAGFISTQFTMDGLPNEYQLNRTYGDSSPMGLLWTFMAASPAYTFFAGLGEVIGGLLLVFRRTTTLGGLVVSGVMLNVVMMNFCYDVPVKQYSIHLLMMAVFLLLPEFPRIANVLVWNRPTETSNLFVVPYTNSKTIWIHRCLKSLVVICAFAWPVFEHVKREVQHEHQPRVESKHLLINRGFRWINEYPFNK